MGPGGAERVMAYIANYLSLHHDVTLVTLESPAAEPFYPLAPAIKQLRLNLLGGSGRLQRFLRILYRFATIRRVARDAKPDVIVSFLDTMNITATLACCRIAPVVVSERVDPAQYSIGAFKTLLRRLVYPAAACCVVQTKRVAEYFGRWPRPQICVIPNPVKVPPSSATPECISNDKFPCVISVGRLVKQKGFDILIDAFAIVLKSAPHWKLRILGEGPERPALEAQIRALNIAQSVSLPGVIADVESELSQAQIFAFPSRFEGFPNALAEGLAMGLPSVACADISGVEDLVKDGKTGLLLELTDAPDRWAEQLLLLIQSPVLRKQLGLSAREHVKAWDIETVCRMWERQLEAVARFGARWRKYEPI